MTSHNYIYAYYQQICDGSVHVGRWIRLIYEYIIKGLDEKHFVFDQKKANEAIEWIEEHTFHVERQFREVLLLIGRKNGKSILASAIANYVFRHDGGYGARVYNVAPKLEQADIIYGNAWAITQLDPDQINRKELIEQKRSETHSKVQDDPEIIKKRASDLYYPATNSTMKKIAFSAKKADGFNPSLAICDEIAAWEGDRGLKQYEVMKSGQGARPDGLLLSCTTSGYVNDSIFDELTKRSTRFLLGDSKETRLLPFMYMIDDVDKWNDINELRKANPNLGVSITVDYLLEEIAVAEGSLSKKAEFICKYCNIKQNSSLAWLPAQVVNGASGEHLELEDFSGCYCVGGIDLSQTRDLTACTAVIEKGGKLYVFAHFFLPAERIDEATQKDGIPYMAYVQREFLTLSGDNFVDYHDCFRWFADLVEKYKILPLKVGYDRYSAQYLVQDMSAYGFHMDDVYQGENLYGVIQETQGMMEDGKICIGDNDLLKIHLLNSAIKMSTERGRGKLVKLSWESLTGYLESPRNRRDNIKVITRC